MLYDDWEYGQIKEVTDLVIEAAVKANKISKATLYANSAKKRAKELVNVLHTLVWK